MKTKSQKTVLSTLLFAAACLLASPVMADKPDWADGGKPGKHDKGDRHDRHGDNRRDSHEHRGGPDRRDDLALRGYFTSDQRSVVRGYYDDQFKSGHCPPGLAKKHNGCLPPGQAKKWAIGQPLGGLAYYAVPSVVLGRLGQPPAGYKYVRVAGDILLIAIGTSMVVDAIEDLGGLY